MIFNASNKTTLKIRYNKNTYIQQCYEYVYLGITFTPSGSFKKAKKVIAAKANRALFILRQAVNKYNSAQPDLMLRLFDKAILPIMLYGSEVWGFSDIRNHPTTTIQILQRTIDDMDKIHIKFCKQLLGVKWSTGNMATLSELARLPLISNIIPRTVKYFLQKYHEPPTSFVKPVLRYSLKTPNSVFSIVKSILLETKLWDQCIIADTAYKIQSIVSKLKALIPTTYQQHILEESKKETKLASLFWAVKRNNAFPNYLKEIKNVTWRQAITKFRLSSHELPIE
jgi:hypothetical protein